jgi:hypothetical protein
VQCYLACGEGLVFPFNRKVGWVLHRCDNKHHQPWKFCFGQLEQTADSAWQEGNSNLDKARPRLLRSIRDECRTNEGGKWFPEYEYVVESPAKAGHWEYAPRDFRESDAPNLAAPNLATPKVTARFLHATFEDQSAQRHGLKAGDKIEAQFMAEGDHPLKYSGRIAKVNIGASRCTYDVKFDILVLRDDLREPQLRFCDSGGTYRVSSGSVVQLQPSNCGHRDCPRRLECGHDGCSESPCTARDCGHDGRGLAWFCDHPAAREAKLTHAEVAMLRLYTGPMYTVLNGALREYQSEAKLQDWWTCITVLICATSKMSFVRWYQHTGGICDKCESQQHLPTSGLTACRDCTNKMTADRAVEKSLRRVYCGISTSGSSGLSDAVDVTTKAGETLDFARNGGVELAFRSTTTHKTVAQRFATGEGGVIINLDICSTTRGAGVQWVSQYPGEAEWLLPPSTLLSPQKEALGGREHAPGINVPELYFAATVRVPFEELNMRVLEVTDVPKLAGGNDKDASIRSLMEEMNHGESLQRDLDDGRVDAGMQRFHRGFFGGSGVKAGLCFLALGLLPQGLLADFLNGSRSSVAILNAVVATMLLLQCWWRACILFALNYHIWKLKNQKPNK